MYNKSKTSYNIKLRDIIKIFVYATFQQSLRMWRHLIPCKILNEYTSEKPYRKCFRRNKLKIEEAVLGIDSLSNIYSGNDTLTIRRAIEKYQDHPSKKLIGENINSNNNFSFDLTNPEWLNKIINNLEISKATQQGDIPSKIIEDNKDFFNILLRQALKMRWIRVFFQTN